MRLCIPTIGNKIKLTEEWQFPLFTERRNKTLFQFLFPDKNWNEVLSQGWWDRRNVKPVAAKLPAGVELVFDRLYLAKNNTMYRSNTKPADFHSVTFVIQKNDPVLQNKRQLRFWVKLRDANLVQCEFTEDVLP